MAALDARGEPEAGDAAARRTRSAAAVDLDRLIADHQDRIARLASRMLGWPQDVADVVQDVFVSALANLPKFRGECEIGTWLTAIAINTCRRHRRRRMLQWRAWTERVRQWRRQEASRDAAPSDAGATRRDEAARVRRAVDRLPHRDRELIVLRHLEGLPTAQIARLTGVSASVVDVRLSRARARLRRILETDRDIGSAGRPRGSERKQTRAR